MKVKMVVPDKENRMTKVVLVPCEYVGPGPGWTKNQVYVKLLRACWIVAKGETVLVFDSTITV
jgi:hypothetical protein